MYDTDYLIIGSGINSLSCALVLSKAGYSVMIVEGAKEIGGAARTAEITVPGLKHDLYAANIGLFLGSPVYAEFQDDINRHGFSPVMSACPMASVFPDHTGNAIFTDHAKTDSMIRQFSEHDADAVNELFTYFREVAPFFLPLLQKKMPSVQAFKQIALLYRKLGPRQTHYLINLLCKSPRQYCSHWFEHPKTQALFLPWAMHLDFGPDVSGGATFPFVEPPTYHDCGMPLARGGVQAIVQSMA